MPYISHHAARSAFAEWLGTGRKDAFKSADVSESDLRTFGLEVGQFFQWDNTIYRAVRAKGAITAAGYAVKNYFGNAARTGTANATGSTKQKMVTADNFAAGEVLGGFVWDVSGTATGRRKILAHTSGAGSVLTVSKRQDHINKAATSAADAFTNAPDGTTTYHVHCDWDVVMTSAATDFVEGIALGAVTSGNLTIVAVEGPYVEIYCDGSTNALTAGGMVVPSGTAGVSKGPAAGPTAAEVAVAYAWSYDAYSGSGALRVCRFPGRFKVGGQRNISAM